MSRPSRPCVVIVSIALLSTVLLPVAPGARAGAQQGGHGSHAAPAGASPSADSTSLAAATDHAMGAHGHHDAIAMAHLLMTPTRRVEAGDSARAANVVVALREATTKYADVRRAEADGYRMFAPEVAAQRVYHFTRNRNAIAAAFHFDPAQPTSLLYVKQADGAMKLVGAMYTAPRRASMEELDRRVPLSMAQWHRHVSICIPPRGARERWAEKDASGTMKFGPAGSIATEDACDAAGGRWLESLFGWMVHVNAWASDPRDVFEDPAGH